MKKTILLFILCASLALCVTAQDRTLPTQRAFQPAPVLHTWAGTQEAAGVAQTPSGYGLPLYLGCPAQSRVSLYGQSLSGVSSVMLWHSRGVTTVPAQATRFNLPGLEAITFPLPAGVTGEVWITTAGRQQPSNLVRLFVE